MGPDKHKSNEGSNSRPEGNAHYSFSLEERVEILAQDPVRFFTSANAWCGRGECRMEILDGYLEEALKDEKYGLCHRIRQVQRLLMRKAWMEKNPARPEEGPVRVNLRIFRPRLTVPVYEVECDLADDPVAAFRSLQRVQRKDFVRPLILKPDDPDLPMLVYSSFPFPVEQICITRFTRRIEKLGTIAPSATCGQFIQSFTGHSMIILAPEGFIKKYRINVSSLFRFKLSSDVSSPRQEYSIIKTIFLGLII